MPLNPRVRGNNSFGTVTDNPLTAAAITMNSLGLSTLPPVVAQHAVLTLDPLREFGEPEIVVVTAHTASATIATIVRGQYGTSARDHPSGTIWVHAPITDDFIRVVTSGARPSDPYEGQFIYETDTNKLVGYGGVDWAPRDAGGQLGYAQSVTTESALIDADVAGITTVVTVATGRRIKVTWYERNIIGTVSPDSFDLKIQQDGSDIQASAFVIPSANNANRSNTVMIVVTPTAGPHTYKAHVTRTSGSGSIQFGRSATTPGFILVEDIGAA